MTDAEVADFVVKFMTAYAKPTHAPLLGCPGCGLRFGHTPTCQVQAALTCAACGMVSAHRLDCSGSVDPTPRTRKTT